MYNPATIPKMKKIFPSRTAALLVLFMMAISLNACNNSERYTLKMRLDQGDHFEQDMKTVMEMNTPVMGKAMNMKMDIEVGCAFDVIKKDASGTQLKMSYSRNKTKMDMGALNGLNGATDSLLNRQNSSLNGKSVVLVLSNNNQIKEVIGAENIFSGDSTDEATKKMMQKMFSKDQIANLWGMMFSMYPKKPVRVGDSWKGETQANMGGFDMTINMKYKLTAVTNGLAEIEVDGIIDGKGKMTEMPMEMDMKGSQKGTMTIKLSDGYLQKGKYKMDVTANMEMMGQKIPMTLKGDYSITGK